MTLSMHILKSRKTSNVWKRCLASAEKSGVDFTVINNNKKDILHGRKKGFDCDGTHVTMLDDDDETLLTLEEANRLIALNKPALFTNSWVTEIGKPLSTNVPSYINKWQLGHELNRLCRPHFTMVLEKDYANQILKETESELVKNGWHNNFTDFIFRCIISANDGWHYDPAITYNWYIHSEGHHALNSSAFADMRKYFFGKKQ